MNANKREQLRVTLRKLAQANAASIEFMEQALTLVRDDLALDPLTFWRSRTRVKPASRPGVPFVDQETLSIKFRGRSCFLGNTLPFRLFARLAQRPNVYLTY